MPSVSRKPPASPVVGELFVLEDENARSSVTLAPQRGALVTSFRVENRELLYLDESTLVDASKSVRGGVPVLFPSPGKLEDNQFQALGRPFEMKQHGFARTLPWQVSRIEEAGHGATVSLVLESNDVTRSQYPWDFVATFSFTLAGASLRIVQNIENRSREPMPYAVGFHPYFALRDADKAAARIDTRATRAFDNVTKSEGPFAGFDLTAREVDVHLIDHGSTASALHLGDGARIDVRGSSDFWRWVIWTLAGKDFVCLEPWSAAGNALNTGETLIRLPPSGAHESWIEIALASD